MILFGVCKYFDSECKHIINCSKSKSDSLECTVGRFVNKEVVKKYLNDLTSKVYIPFYDKLWKNRLLNSCNKNEGKPQAKVHIQNFKIFSNGIWITLYVFGCI